MRRRKEVIFFEPCKNVDKMETIFIVMSQLRDYREIPRASSSRISDMISARNRIPLEVLDVPYRIWTRQSGNTRTHLTRLLVSSSTETACLLESIRAFLTNLQHYVIPIPRHKEPTFHQSKSRAYQHSTALDLKTTLIHLVFVNKKHFYNW